MSTGISALAFIPMPIGACLDIGIVLWWERYLERAKARNAPWALNEEYRRMPLACIGGPLCALSLFWLVRQLPLLSSPLPSLPPSQPQAPKKPEPKR